MSYSEKIIWDTITESAKNRFDYNLFAEQFDEFDDDNISDNILFTLIVSFANKEKVDTIQFKLLNQMVISRINWKPDEIKSFINGKEELLQLEIYATQIAYTLLSDGSDPNDVLNIVKRLINSN